MTVTTQLHIHRRTSSYFFYPDNQCRPPRHRESVQTFVLDIIQREERKIWPCSFYWLTKNKLLITPIVLINLRLTRYISDVKIRLRLKLRNNTRVGFYAVFIRAIWFCSRYLYVMVLSLSVCHFRKIVAIWIR